MIFTKSKAYGKQGHDKDKRNELLGRTERQTDVRFYDFIKVRSYECPSPPLSLSLSSSSFLSIDPIFMFRPVVNVIKLFLEEI